MKSLWAIIPVKSIKNGKSRLASILSLNERKILNTSLLDHTIRILNNKIPLINIYVVSQDINVLNFAHSLRVQTIFEKGLPDLNKALNQAVNEILCKNIDHLFIFPSDLPLLSNNDIKSMLYLSGNKPGMVIAPDRKKIGTNGLLINPPGFISFQFGDGSYQTHIDQAIKSGIPYLIYDSISLGLDLDLPEDFEYLMNNKNMIDDLKLLKIFNDIHYSRIKEAL